MKSLDLARITEDPDVIVAYQMNGQPLPMLNGYPARLVVPGWYATYWVKNLSEIEVIDHVFEKFWMKPAYRIPDTPCGCVEPGTAPARTVPITRLTVRSFIAVPAPGARVGVGQPVTVRGIAFDGGYGISEVQLSRRRGSHMASRPARARPGPLLVPRVVGGVDAAEPGKSPVDGPRLQRDRRIPGNAAPLEPRRLPPQRHRARRRAGRVRRSP